MKRKDRAAKARWLQAEINKLMMRLVELAVDEPVIWEPNYDRWVGSKVMVTRKDVYFGRVGIVDGLREKKSPAWHIVLEHKSKEEPQVQIWKHEKYLRLMTEEKKGGCKSVDLSLVYKLKNRFFF